MEGYSKFSFILDQDVEGYFGLDFYTDRMYPNGCANGGTGSMTVIRDSTFNQFAYMYYNSNYDYINQVWKAGRYEVITQVYWSPDEVRDYAFRTYLPV